MKSGYHSIEELDEEITRRAKAKEDLIVSSKNLEVAPWANPGVALMIKGRNDPVAINKIAHRQIQGHLKIPADYYDRMLAEDPELLATNINRWLWKNRENRLVRMLFGSARAFLSDRFRPLENEDLARAALPALRASGADIMSAQITDQRFYIKAVDHKVTRELARVGSKFGDGKHNIVHITSPAITISNSEVGWGSLSVLGGVYDDFCSNLATFSERSLRKYHVGAKHELTSEETFHLLSDETRRKTDEALWSQIGDIIKGAFDRARFDALVDKIEATTEDKIDTDDVVKSVSFASKKLGLTEVEGNSVLKHLVEDGDGLTRFGFFNAVTRASTDLDDYDRSTELERMGGKIVEMQKGEWKELLAA